MIFTIHKKIKYFLFFFLISSTFHAQILEEFPSKQEYYTSGEAKLYEEIQNIIVTKKITPCENKKEIYKAKILLTKDAKIKLVKDFDSVNIAMNKCAHDITIELLKSLKDDKNWKPAIVKKENHDALLDLYIFPIHFFENYKKGYTPEMYFIPPSYNGGKNKYDKDFQGNFKAIFSDYHVNGKFLLNYMIDENGKIMNPILKPEISNPAFKQDIFRALQRMEGNWKPALLDGVPVKHKMSIIIDFSINFYEK